MAPTPAYAELHCHSAYSFLDGVSLPHELAQRAGELGYTTLALTDHNSVSGSMELAEVAAGHGVRAIHGAEIDVAVDPPESAGSASDAGATGAADVDSARTRHITLLVRNERGWSNLCRIITLAHAHTREGSAGRELGEARVGLGDVVEHAEGLVCLTGCAGRSVIGATGLTRPGRDRAGATGPSPTARRPSGARDEPTARRLLDAFGPAGPVRGAAAPVRPPRPRPQPGAGGAGAAAGDQVRGHRRRPRARAREGRAAGRVRGVAPPHHP